MEQGAGFEGVDRVIKRGGEESEIIFMVKILSYSDERGEHR